jgi:hypothetical protein
VHLVLSYYLYEERYVYMLLFVYRALLLQVCLLLGSAVSNKKQLFYFIVMHAQHVLIAQYRSYYLKTKLYTLFL